MLPQTRALGQADVVELQSDARFSSALYETGPVNASVTAHSVAAWDAMGRHAQSSTGTLPPSSIFDKDLAIGWSELDQSGVQSTLRSFVQASGYYFNSGGPSFASTHVTIHNRLLIENNGPNAVNIVATYSSHGFLFSGGDANNVTASAAESMSIDMFDASGPLQSSHWSGSASVFAEESTPTVSVLGDWAGQTSSATRFVPHFADAFEGIELNLLLATSAQLIPAGDHINADVSFQGSYSADSSLLSAFLSMAQVDFSATGGISYAAFDAVTGLPSNDVTFTLVDVPAPGGMVAASLCSIMSLRRSRRTLVG